MPELPTVPTKVDFEAQWNQLPQSPSGEGPVVLLVTRASAADMPKGQDKLSTPMHMQPQAVSFTTEGGVAGDRWKEGKEADSQISLTSLAVTKLIAGSKERWHLVGNNLIVDLDLSAEALPVGTRLRVGTGEIQISAMPHDPCDRYQARFGKAAHDWVADEKHASRHLRGRYARVTRSGEVAIGDLISIVPS